MVSGKARPWVRGRSEFANVWRGCKIPITLFCLKILHLKLWMKGSSEELFVSRQMVSGFPDKGADLWEVGAVSEEAWGISGEVWETFGEPLALDLLLKSIVREVLGKSPGNFQGGGEKSCCL